jgi:copper(I)-binding protein
MSHPSRVALAALALVALVASLAGCGAGGDPAEASGSLQVLGATVDRPANPSQASVRFVIDNGTDRADELRSVSSPQAGGADVHRSEVDDDGLATMTAVDGLPVPARSTVTFEPGGLHVMLRDLREPLVVGQVVELELTFAEAGVRRVEAVVVEPGADGGSETEHDTHAG